MSLLALFLLSYNFKSLCLCLFLIVVLHVYCLRNKKVSSLYLKQYYNRKRYQTPSTINKFLNYAISI